MTDQFQWWRDALAGNTGPIYADAPQSGYYRMRDSMSGPWLPVAIWTTDDGKMNCRVGGETRDPVKTWLSCSKRPVAKDVARAVFAGANWPDMPDNADPSNMPQDPFEALLCEVEDKTAQAAEFLSAEGPLDQVRSDKARNIQAQLLALRKQADAMHKAEKAPLLSAARECDEKYRFRDKVDSVAAELRRVFESFMLAEEVRLKREAEAKWRAEQEAARVERERAEAERAALLKDDPIAALTTPEPELPIPAPAPEQVKVSAGGGVGRKAGLKTVYVAKVTDYGKAAAYFSSHPDVRALIDKLAQREAASSKGSAKIDGITMSEERRAA